MCDPRLLLGFFPDRSWANLAMPSGAAKVSPIDQRQNLTVLELASWHNPNATENVNA
jgi:hypothetical protein